MALDDPARARKTLLTTNRTLLQTLNQQQDYKKRIEEKKRYLLQFTKTRRELDQVLSRLQKKLPQRNITLRKTPAPTVDNLPPTAPKQQKMTALEQELNRIDNQLGSMKEQ